MDMIKLILALTLASACSHADAQTACSPPIGGYPDDGVDDRAAIQAALTSAGCVTLAAGVYDVGMPPIGANGRRPLDSIALGNGEIVGVGSPSVLRFYGDATGGDWHGIGMAGGNVHDLTIDMSALTGTSEQTHGIRVSGPATSPLVTHVSFNNPQRGMPGGDCIQLVGYDVTPITGARIIGNAFTHCDRSGVAAHSGVIDLQITDNVFADVGDQDIDGEGSGGSSHWLLARNTHMLSPSAQGDMAIQIQLTSDVRITESTFAGRGLFLYGCTGCEIDHDDIVRTTGVSGSGVIEIRKDSSGINIHDNQRIERSASAGVGAVIRAIPQGSGQPADLHIVDNVIAQRNTGNIVDAYGIVGLEFSRNSVTYTGPAGSTIGVSANGSTTTRTTAISLVGNSFGGPLQACLRLSGSYAGAGTASTVGNVAAGAGQGIRCENVNSGSKVLGPVISSANLWPPPVCGSVVVEVP